MHKHLTDQELNKRIRMAENELGTLRVEWFMRNGRWCDIGWVGWDNRDSFDGVSTGNDPISRKKKDGI